MPKRNKKCQETKEVASPTPTPTRRILVSSDVCTHDKMTSSSCSTATANSQQCPKWQEMKGVTSLPPARRVLESLDVCARDKMTSSSCVTSTASNQQCPKWQETKEVTSPSSARCVLESLDVCARNKMTSSSCVTSTASNQQCPKWQETKEVTSPSSARRVLESLDVCARDKMTSSSCVTSTASNQQCPKWQETKEVTSPSSARRVLESLDVCTHVKMTSSCGAANNQLCHKPPCCRIPSVALCVAEAETCHDTIDEEQNTVCPATNTCCPGGIQIKTLKDAIEEFKKLECCSEGQENSSSKSSSIIPVSQKQSNLNIEGTSNKDAVSEKVPVCPPTTNCLQNPGDPKDDCTETKLTSKESCCSSPVCGFPKDEPKKVENQTCSQCSDPEVKEDGTKAAPIKDAIKDIDTNEGLCDGVCATSHEQTTSEPKCECHFPPAFNKFGCSGNISGKCNCALNK